MVLYGKQTIDQGDINDVRNILKGEWITKDSAVETIKTPYTGLNKVSNLLNKLIYQRILP